MTKARQEDLLPYLGKVPDIEIAKRFGISRERVRQYRKKYGIPKYDVYSRITDEIAAVIGKVSDLEVAKQFDVPAGLVVQYRKKHKIPAYDSVLARIESLSEADLEALGKVSDSKIGKQYGWDERAVLRMRARLGVKVDERRATRWKPAFDWTPETDALLGTKPDRLLAEELGIKTHHVYMRRVKLGIKSYRSRNKTNG